MQEFANFSDDSINVTLVPRDAFCLRLDLDVPAFEALGNDQNYKEVTKDQDGVTDFRFRYSLVARLGGYDGADAVASAASAHTPLLCTPGRLASKRQRRDGLCWSITAVGGDLFEAGGRSRRRWRHPAACGKWLEKRDPPPSALPASARRF